MQDHNTILSVLSEENVDVNLVLDLMAACKHMREKEAAKLQKEEQRHAKGKDRSQARVSQPTSPAERTTKSKTTPCIFTRF
jgi:hypothetical protein